MAYSWGLYTSIPAAPTLALSADTGTYTGTRTEILFTPQNRLLIAVETKGILEFAPPFASHATLNRGLGWDSTAIFQDMQYDDQDNL